MPRALRLGRTKMPGGGWRCVWTPAKSEKDRLRAGEEAKATGHSRGRKESVSLCQEQSAELGAVGSPQGVMALPPNAEGRLQSRLTNAHPREDSKAPPGEELPGLEPPGERPPGSRVPRHMGTRVPGRPWPPCAHGPAQGGSGTGQFSRGKWPGQWGGHGRQGPWGQNWGQDGGTEASRSGQSLRASGQLVHTRPPALSQRRVVQRAWSPGPCSFSQRAGPVPSWGSRGLPWPLGVGGLGAGRPRWHCPGQQSQPWVPGAQMGEGRNS